MSFDNIRNPQLREDLVDIFGDIISYASDTDTLTIAGNVSITGSLSYGSVSVPVSQSLLGTLTVGISGTGYDVKYWGDTAGKYWLWDESADGVVLAGTFTQTGNMAVEGTFTLTGAPSITGNMDIVGTLSVGVDNTGHDVKFFGATASKYWLWDESEDQMVIAGSVAITGNSQFTGTVTVGVNDTGHDVKFYGAGTGKYWLWDESEDGVVLVGTMSITGATALTGTLTASGVTNVSCTTDASAVGTAALKTAGGLGVAKKAYIGTDLVLVAKGIDMSTAGTGSYDITLKTNMADALSIKDSTADIIVFATTTGTPVVTVTPISTFTGIVTINGGITMGDAKNIAVNTTTGTKIGTATSQKLGFFNATPVVQPAAAAQAAAPAGGTGAAEGGWDTAGHRDSAIATINAIRTALVNLGIIKGEV